MNKIFSIGFNKTGTTTLEKCLKDLDLLPQAAWEESHKLNYHWFKNDYKPIIEFAKSFKSLSDNPWNIKDFYKILDINFPNSKFILTTREPTSWFHSLRKWCTPRYGVRSSIRSLPDGPAFHKAIFGMTEDSIENYEDHYKHVYEQRNQEIKKYFAKRPDDLLVIDWTKHGWKELCEFLDKPIPNRPVPHLNKSKKR